MLPAFKNEIKGQPSCSTAIKVSKYGRIVDLLICYFTPFGDAADVAGLSEKKWQMNTCVCPSSSQSCLKMRLKWWKDQRMEREAKKSASDINGLTSPSDRSIGRWYSLWSWLGKGVHPLYGKRITSSTLGPLGVTRCRPKSGPRWPIRR